MSSKYGMDGQISFFGTDCVYLFTYMNLCTKGLTGSTAAVAEV